MAEGTGSNSFIDDLKQQCIDRDTTKYVNVILFCENEATLETFFKYIDSIDESSNTKLSAGVLALFPIGYYSKTITTDEGWRIVLNMTCLPPPWQSTSLEMLPKMTTNPVESQNVHHVLLLDWTDEMQSYWLNDIESLFSQLQTITPKANAKRAIMFLNSDYSKHLVNTHVKWSPSSMDFLHQSVRTLALHLNLSLFSDMKNSILSTRCALGISDSTADLKSVSDLINVESMNISYGLDSFNKIALINENYNIDLYKQDLSALKSDYSTVVPILKTRKKTSHDPEEVPDLFSLIPNVQEELASLYELQKQHTSFKSSLNHTATEHATSNNTVEDASLSAQQEETLLSSTEDNALDSLVQGIVQRHQIL